MSTAPQLTEAAQKRHYADVRSRLYGSPRRARVAFIGSAIHPVSKPAAPEPKIPEPVKAAPPPEPPKPQPLGWSGAVRPSAPLNMLKPPSWRFLVEVVALKHGVPVKEIMGPSRARKTVAVRYEAMAVVYRHTQASLTRVGVQFERDHTTVLHALRKVHGDHKLIDAPTIVGRSGRPPKHIHVEVRN